MPAFTLALRATPTQNTDLVDSLQSGTSAFSLRKSLNLRNQLGGVSEGRGIESRKATKSLNIDEPLPDSVANQADHIMNV